jgi:hypothetical protein
MTSVDIPARAGSGGVAAAKPSLDPSTKNVFLGALVVLLLLTLQDGDRLLFDPDCQWHIAIGRWIWAHKAVPWVDEFSYTFAGQPWLAKEWLSQLAYYGAFEAAGWRGAVIIASVALAAAFALIYGFVRERVRAPIPLIVVLVAFLLTMVHMVARPHALVLPVVVIWMRALAVAREREEAPSPWLALLMVLWTNMHGSFPLGVGMAAILAAEGVLLGKSGTFATRFIAWFWFGAATLAATLATPYGWQAILIPLKMEGQGQALRYIQEWNPISFDMYGAQAVAAMAAALGCLVADWKRNAFRILAVGLLSLMAIDHIRFISTFAIVSPMLIATALARRPGFAAQPAAPATAYSKLTTGALAAAALALCIAIQPAPSVEVAPEAALRAAREKGLTGRVFNDYSFGGFLIAQGVPTFIDGRTDQLFLGDFMPKLYDSLDKDDTKDFSDILDRYGVEWALVRSDSTRAKRLAVMPGWTEVHRDETAAVFARKARTGR